VEGTAGGGFGAITVADNRYFSAESVLKRDFYIRIENIEWKKKKPIKSFKDDKIRYSFQKENFFLIWTKKKYVELLSADVKPEEFLNQDDLSGANGQNGGRVNHRPKVDLLKLLKIINLWHFFRKLY